MSGRAEQDKQREEWIQDKLNGQPQILRSYMRSIRRKTSSTRKAYLGYLIQYIDFMNYHKIKLTEVIPMDLDTYVEHISYGNGVSIINTKLAAISSFYNFLEINHFIKSNPCTSDLKIESEQEEQVIYMTDEEVEHVKKNAVNRKNKYANRDLCIITLGCATGLRVSAIRNIDIEDIDFDNKTIKVIEKGNKERTIYIGDNTVNIIKQWMGDRYKLYGNNKGALFMSQKHNRIAVRTIQEMIHNASKDLGKHITPHKMRSTCAMKLYEKTGDIYLTAQQLGHSNVENTKKYARATEDRRREAALILD